MFKCFTAILADTRVGSTALGTGLDNDKTSFFLGEVLYPEVSDPARHLYGRILELDLKRTLLEQQYVFGELDKFFSSSEWDPNYQYFFDIKYHDLNILPKHPLSLSARPMFLEYLCDREFKILHLNRKNKLAAALSQEVAMVTNVFHSSDATRPQDGVTMDIDQLISGAILRERAHQQVRAWLRDYRLVLDVDYEALFTAPGKAMLDSFLRDRWGIADVVFDTKLQRLSTTQGVHIENVSEIEACFLNLPFVFDVDEALRPYKGGQAA